MAFRKKQPAPEQHEPPQQYYKDQLFPDAVEVTLETQCVSAGRLQSMLRIGSIRSTNLLKELEELGIIGPERGNRPREIFYTMERWNEEKKNFAWKPEPPKPEPEPVKQFACPHCKKTTSQEAAFCSHCGKQLTAKPKRFRKFIKTVLLVFLLLAIVGSFLPDDPQEAAPTMSKDAYKSKCRTVSYESLARNPDSYKGEYLTYVGEVIQVLESGKNVQLRVNVTEYEVYGTYFSKDTIYVTAKLSDDGPRILEKDIIRLYGICEGLHTYSSVIGTTISIPSIRAEYWELVN